MYRYVIIINNNNKRAIIDCGNLMVRTPQQTRRRCMRSIVFQFKLIKAKLLLLFCRMQMIVNNTAVYYFSLY